MLKKESGQTKLMLTASVVEMVGMGGQLDMDMVSSALHCSKVLNVVVWTLAIVGVKKDLLGHTWTEN